MNLYEMFKTDDKAEHDGIDLEYGSAAIRVRRAGGSNRAYSAALTRRLKPHRRQLDNDTIDPDLVQRIMAEVFADTIITGWRGVTAADGSALPYSRDAAVRLLLDLPDLFRDIQEQAAKLANFRADELEAELKN